MIALGRVMEKSLLLQIMVVSLIAILATIGVCGLVALLVRMDDVGYFLIESAQKMQGGIKKVVASVGSLLVESLPKNNSLLSPALQKSEAPRAKAPRVKP